MLYPTPGITEPKFTMDPIGTEAEMTEGPMDYNPYEDGTPPRDPVDDPEVNELDMDELLWG
jgi:hypothetical protein